MDALKKAEAAKRQGAEEKATPAVGAGDSKYAELSLQPIDVSLGNAPVASVTDNDLHARPENSPAHLPELPTHLGGLDAEFVAHHKERRVAPKPPVELSLDSLPALAIAASPAPVAEKAQPLVTTSVGRTERDAARNLFDVKAKTPPAGNKNFAIAMGVLIVAVALSAGGYFWWQLQPKSGIAGDGITIRPVVPVNPTPPSAATPAATPTSAGNGMQASPQELPIRAPSSVSPPGQLPAASATGVTTALAKAPVPIPMQAEKRKRAESAGDSVSNDAARLVRVTKSPLQANPALIRGFENFNRGDLAAARVEYESVLKVEPQNVEALHGLAAIAVREGRFNVADHFYERILVADPKDAAAMSAMINLHSQDNLVVAESRLKGIASEQPGSSSAQFALGNLYASQKRWADAQQSYFKAYSADPDNPDILYNLAVSLEHMNQTKLAHQYYSLALEAAMRRPAGFDTAVVGSRIAALKP